MSRNLQAVHWPVLLLTALHGQLRAQGDTTLMVADEQYVHDETAADGTDAIETYEPLNAALGGDSVRFCDGSPCTGWVEDHYPNGQLLHRGYYKDGQLLVYKNYHVAGKLEREFKVTSDTKCLLRTYHDNGNVRSEVDYVSGDALHYTDHYPNGQLRYEEQKHPEDPYYTMMDLFAEDGKPISTLHIIDKRKVIFEQKEYWPSGVVRIAGRSQFNPRRFDSQRIGEWTYYTEQGIVDSTERYIDGKVSETAQVGK
ncbi:MAG: hypothetical protein IPO90_05100 [Flavobacteriales bacterium]|nr:hypothetical protein [Flavobacteriales bacterium]